MLFDDDVAVSDSLHCCAAPLGFIEKKDWRNRCKARKFDFVRMLSDNFMQAISCLWADRTITLRVLAKRLGCDAVKSKPGGARFSLTTGLTFCLFAQIAPMLPCCRLVVPQHCLRQHAKPECNLDKKALANGKIHSHTIHSVGARGFTRGCALNGKRDDGLIRITSSSPRCPRNGQRTLLFF
jgi:hypothetical protein